jgi:diketogulonate reductase-like aldo/keto reductase
MVENVDRLAGMIPLWGFGTFRAADQCNSLGTVKQAVLAALKTGYRHIDTALTYGNGQVEKEVGEAIRGSGIPRDEILVVTKL